MGEIADPKVPKFEIKSDQNLTAPIPSFGLI